MSTTPFAHMTMTTVEDWPMVRKHMILNGVEHLMLTIEQFDHLVSSLPTAAAMEELVEMRSTLAEIHRLTAT